MSDKMFRMSELKDRFSGQPAAILGGGPSLPSDFERLPKNCVLIAVNYHAFHIPGVDINFMVYNDQPEEDSILAEAVRARRAILVSSDPSSDVEFDVPVWTGFLSSNTAAWFALWMGCNPVILCGMDCYQGDRVYFHNYNHDCPAFHYPVDHYTRPWIEEGRNKLPHVERVKAMSGPLTAIFGAYQG